MLIEFHSEKELGFSQCRALEVGNWVSVRIGHPRGIARPLRTYPFCHTVINRTAWPNCEDPLKLVSSSSAANLLMGETGNRIGITPFKLSSRGSNQQLYRGRADWMMCFHLSWVFMRLFLLISSCFLSFRSSWSKRWCGQRWPWPQRWSPSAADFWPPGEHRRRSSSRGHSLIAVSCSSNYISRICGANRSARGLDILEKGCPAGKKRKHTHTPDRQFTIPEEKKGVQKKERKLIFLTVRLISWKSNPPCSE